MESGGASIGALTRHLSTYELRFEGLTRLELVDTLAQRKERMSELSDAVVVLPGGTGTLDALCAWVAPPPRWG